MREATVEDVKSEYENAHRPFLSTRSRELTALTFLFKYRYSESLSEEVFDQAIADLFNDGFEYEGWKEE